MNKHICKILLIITIISLLTGCSSNSRNPIIPSDSVAVLDLPTGEISTPEISRTLLGTWLFNLNPNVKTIVVNPYRDISGWTQNHLNVKPFLPVPTAQLISYNPVLNIYDVDVTINNNSNYDGYDVRLIIHTTDRGILLLNDDGWTPLWDEIGGSLINPFRAYARLEPKHKFAAHTNHTERLQIYLPAGWGSVSFAIDASYGGNCVEPYLIQNFTQGTLYDIIDSETTVSVEVYDWQNDTDVVGLYCPQITGGGWESFTQVSSIKWQLLLVNRTAAPEGEYLGVLKASSPNLGSLILYDLVNITVTHTLITDWTILVYYHEAADLVNFSRCNINLMELAGSLGGRLNILLLWNKNDNTSENDEILMISRDTDDNLSAIPISQPVDDGDVVPDSGQVDMGDGNTMERFLNWGMVNYPAQNYGLVIFDHGNGPFGVIQNPLAVLNCCGGLSVWEIRDACQNALNEHPETEKLTFIGFHACLMSWLETAYCLKDVCDYCIASEMLGWTSCTRNYCNWPYETFLEYLRNNSNNWNINSLSQVVVNDYLASFPDPPPQDARPTLAVWESQIIDTAVVPALNDFSDQLIQCLPDPDYNNEITNCWSNSGSWAWTPGGGQCSEQNVKDLGYFAELISNANVPTSLQQAATALVSAIDSAMIFHDHRGSNTPCHSEETGWQIWLPSNYSDSSNEASRQDYQSLGFNQTQWDEFLNAFDD